ncbi:PAS domain S-box protein [Methanobacterium alkalithermotolerans]|uniref:PAS domain S-box protein n=1 Tax=Methanobacterium alkalithermotolerans TaxID=2731220 RepID=A0A8T8K3A8_9EURY|nr:PAS domain S-box protein [Methanobacterium alkalithermotolerans]QUH22422.1 PAS domain S-box protein [Methanobacterium alkalithermotolerans]
MEKDNYLGEIKSFSTLEDDLNSLKPHQHIALLYNNPREWKETIIPFIKWGLEKGEKCVYIRDSSQDNKLQEYLKKEGVEVNFCEKSGQLVILDESEAYTKDGDFNSDTRIHLIKTEAQIAKDKGFKALRICGEMSWVLHDQSGLDRLMEYESQLNQNFTSKYPSLAICQFDMQKFDPEIIKGVIMTHPYLINGGEIYKNFYHVPAHEFQDTPLAEKEVEIWLNNIKREHKIRLREELYAEVLSKSSQAFVIGLSDGKILFNNPAFNELVGYSPDEIKSLNWDKDLTSPECRHQEKIILQEMEKTGLPVRYEKEYLKKDGTRVPIEILTHPSYNHEGELKYYYSFINDISSRKKVEEELLISENKYHTLFDNAESGIFLIRDGFFMECNQKVLEIFGVLEENILGKTPADFSPPLQEDGTPSDLKAKKLMEKALSGEPQHFEWKHQQQNGTVFFTEVSLNRLKIGEEYLLQAIVMDITGRKRAENLLKESEHKHRMVGELISDFAYSCIQKDGEYRVDWITGSFYHITGFSKKDMDNQFGWMFTVHPDDTPKAQQQLQDIKPGEKNIKIFRIISSQGQIIWLRNHIECVEENGNWRIYGAAQDISREKIYLEDLKRELEINQSLSRIYAPLISDSSSMEDVADIILQESLKLTHSENGYVGMVDPENQDMVVLTHSSMMVGCEMVDLDDKIRFPPSKNGNYPALWGHSLNTGKGIYTNQPETHKTSRGTPSGHIKVTNFISVPVMAEKELLGQIALANSRHDYDDNDLEALKRLAEFYALAIQRMRFKDDLLNSIKDKELLLREIHHRVKNNLQIIASLLNLQSAETQEEEAQEFCRVSQDRVRSMALIHEKLYKSPNISRINFYDYVKSLTEALFYNYTTHPGIVQLNLDIDNISLDLDTAIPCGLLLNELITNSLKYAFPDGNKGTITIKFKSLPSGEYQLVIGDDGIGLPPGFNLDRVETLGLQIVISLVKQIEGTLELEETSGTVYTINFKELSYKNRL